MIEISIIVIVLFLGTNIAINKCKTAKTYIFMYTYLDII